MSKWTLVNSLLIACLLAGCATLGGRDSPDVRIVGLEPLPSEGLELRFALKMRVLNPNDTPIVYDGLAVKLDLDGRGLASGVSDEKGEIPRFGEQVLTLPVSISAFSAVRQFLSRIGEDQTDNEGVSKPISYSLSGKLGGGAGVTGSTRFAASGELDLFSAASDQSPDD
jgi:LEA14-like dessication related protein